MEWATQTIIALCVEMGKKVFMFEYSSSLDCKQVGEEKGEDDVRGVRMSGRQVQLASGVAILANVHIVSGRGKWSQKENIIPYQKVIMALLQLEFPTFELSIEVTMDGNSLLLYSTV